MGAGRLAIWRRVERWFLDLADGCYPPREADSAFIAHSRQDVPNLLAEVRRLRSIVERLAKEGPGLFLGVDAYDCRLCGMRLDGRDHDPSCLWRLAVEAMK